MAFNDHHRHHVWVRETIKQYQSRLLNYAMRITHDTHRAHDAVQETFIKLCNEDQDEMQGHLTEWLYKVCRNKSIDICRREKRMKTIIDITNEPDQLDLNTPEQIAGQNDENSFIMKLVSQLPAREKEILELKFHEGLSYRQISNITGHSKAHIGHLIHQSLNSLKLQLKQSQT